MINFYFYFFIWKAFNWVFFGYIQGNFCINKYTFGKLKQKNAPWKVEGW